ncbi:hypothetical protein O3G_MSEX002725 [Manduca sexta]|uniref:CRAL/TRIO N-terminal domain-containing protein n=1 Tax=Manduca sexta TaxID=7130 RepID=A0A921YPK8_MANSE|nr:hypothetical protein O3G_MSEX002725 [Manduca sexta]
MSKRLTKRFLTDADKYQCSLSVETQTIAENELRETENSRSQALTALRSWMEQNPKLLTVRLDSNFLLRFLRTKKFSVPMAQEAIERYLLLRQSWGIAFNQLDYKLPVMMELIDLGFIFVSPFKDKCGRRVIIYKPGVFDPYKYTNQDMCRVMGICYETIMEDEENQVRGLVHFADGAGVSFPHLTLFTPREAVRIVKNGEYTNQDMCRVMGICYETIMEDEENQVRGLVHFADGAGVSFPHLTLFTPREAVRIVKNGELH